MAKSILALLNDPRYTARNLTIREQTRLAENPNENRWHALFPRRGVNSIKLSELERPLELRLVADRREWNAKGRMAHLEHGPAREMEITPIEMEYVIGERELTLLRESGIEAILRAGVIRTVDRWATALADYVDNGLEYEAFKGWQTGTIVARDAKTGQTATATLGISPDRYVVEDEDYGTLEATTPGSAWEQFLLRLEESEQFYRTAPAKAVRLRRAMLKLLRQSAAQYYGVEAGTVFTMQDVLDNLADEGYADFQFIVDERTLDRYTGAGFEHEAVKLVEETKLLFQPASGVIGFTPFAPVVRAYDFVGDGEGDIVRNIGIFLMEENEGKSLKIQAQANAVPLPDPEAVYVVDAGSPYPPQQGEENGDGQQ